MSWVEIRVLWAREVTQFFRRPLRVAGLLVGPLIWLFVFGFGVSRGLGVRVQGYDYVHFILPGIIGMILINSMSRGGMSILRDREAGFLREVLVAPVSRFSILLGVGLGRVTRALLQAMLIVAAGLFLGVNFGGGASAILSFAAMLGLIVLIGLALASLTIGLAWKMDDMQTYASVSAWAIFPLTLLSGGIYPIQRLPPWLGIPIHLNPLTYGIDSLRWAILGPGAANFPILLDLAVLVGFLLVSMAFGSRVMRTVS